MEEISISQITDPNKQQPFTGYSLQFLQNALRKDDAGIIEALVTKIVGSYSLTVPYVITGCVVTDSGKDVTAGTLFYGGKFYETTSINGTTNVARFIKTKSQDITADPITFSDSTTGNVHDIYKYVPTDVASGGDFTSANLVYLNSSSSVIAQEIALATQTTTSTSYVDMTGLTYTTPNDGITRKFKLTLKGTSIPTVNQGNDSDVIAGGGYFQIWNDSLPIGVGTELDECQHVVSFFNSQGSSQTYGVASHVPFICETIVSLAPNTVIKCRFKKYINFFSTDLQISKVKFFIEEIK